MNSRSRRRGIAIDPIKKATIAALNRVLEPLIELMLDSGVTVHEFNKLVRERAVRVAINRQIKDGDRESKSRAAIMTGLPRSEITKILKSSDPTSPVKSDQLPARRILDAWNDDPRFSGAGGNPATLPIFGRSVSFEQLVDKYGSGIPVRAMLDELTQMEAIERLPNQRVRIRVRIPIITGLTPRSIAAVGERSRDLLQTLAHNRQNGTQPFFEATAVSDTSDRELIAILRREIRAQGIDFINGASSLLNRSESKKSLRSSSGFRGRVGVTIFYFEDEIETGIRVPVTARGRPRKNLRRHRISDGSER